MKIDFAKVKKITGLSFNKIAERLKDQGKYKSVASARNAIYNHLSGRIQSIDVDMVKGLAELCECEHSEIIDFNIEDIEV